MNFKMEVIKSTIAMARLTEDNTFGYLTIGRHFLTKPLEKMR